MKLQASLCLRSSLSFNKTTSLKCSHLNNRMLIRNLMRSANEQPKTVSADEAANLIKSGSRIYLHGVACTPQVLLKSLAKRSDVKDIEFTHLHLEGPNPCIEEAPDRFFSNCFFIGKEQRLAVSKGHASYVPCFLSDIGNFMRRGFLAPDVAFVQVSPPDEHGYVSLGPEVAAALPAIETAPLVIGIINKYMPRSFGASTFPISWLNYIVNHDTPLYYSHSTPPGKIEHMIGSHISTLVRDGATLQMGIGAIPDAVLAALKNHRHLGVHTEMLGQGIVDLVKRGAIDNSRKKFLPYRTVAAFALGDQSLYDMINNNPGIEMHEASITNNPSIIAQNPNVVAVNSIVEMDITGQSCADSVGTRMISGVGGQLDFERGAALSQGGVPILCFSSTAKNGESKVVPTLRCGAGVVTSRAHAHYAVTEYGIAQLHGRNLVQRAKAIIDIAHPDHRENLTREAFNRYKLRTWL